MRSLMLMLLVLLVDVEAKSREALLIGNSEYKYISVLQDPKPSINDLKEALESLDFHVTTAYDLDAENLSAEVARFRDRLSRDSIGFFYYSGHGCQLNNRSYLVPTNVDTKKSSKIKYHALAIEEVLDTLGEARNRVNMLFLDACRDVPTGTRGGTKGLGQISTTPKGTLVVYATESGKVAQDNTLFIKELTKTIQKPNKKVWEIGNDLSNAISKKTNENQVPEMFSKRLPPELMLSSRVVPDVDNTELAKLKAENERLKKRHQEKPNHVSTTKWITPSKSICENNGGKIDNNHCESNWESANKICRASGGNLPGIEVLTKVVSECGGELADQSLSDKTITNKKMIRNKINDSYQQCIKDKGFASYYYWSSITYSDSRDGARLVFFAGGIQGYDVKSSSNDVRCVRVGQ